MPLRTAQIVARAAPGSGRNDPCPCGSGKRFKHCHGALGAVLSPDGIVMRGIDAHRRGELDAAERDYRAALARAPDHALALHYLGVIAYQRGNARDALPLLERATTLRPEESEFHNNLGLVLVELDRYEDALLAHERALSLDPANVTAWNNLGLVLTGCNRLSDAIEALRHAVALKPDFGEAHWNLALALLGNGDFAEGWREYEWRLSLPALTGSTHAPASPRWNGEDIGNGTLLLIAEQGLGDTLQFIRFAQVIAARGIRVIVRAPPRLAPLLANVSGVTEVFSADDPLPAHTMHLPLASIAYALNIDARHLMITRFPYLSIDTARSKSVFEQIDSIAKGAYKVGVAWRAGTRGDTNDRRRSCPLSVLSPLFEMKGIAWFSLQTCEAEFEIDSLTSAARLARLEARNDLSGTGAIASAMDLVISVDTSIVHLAGGLRRPTWVMLPYAADWRWGVSQNETSWYPSARLIRQQQRGDWTGVAAQLCELLTAQLARP